MGKINPLGQLYIVMAGNVGMFFLFIFPFGLPLASRLSMYASMITGTGSCIPEQVLSNQDFSGQVFYASNHRLLEATPPEVIEKFSQITGIRERRYAAAHLVASDLAAIAAEKAIAASGIDPETLDQLIVAHNFGDWPTGAGQPDIMPCLASRVKHRLNIANSCCIAYDILFGCPGWIQGLIQAHASFKAGMAGKILVAGAETLSRVVDRYDRDSLIFADGAGACVLEYQPLPTAGRGILSMSMQSHTGTEADYITMGPSNHPGIDRQKQYMKMKGRQVYAFSLEQVPAVMKDCLDKSGLSISEIKKIFIHQSNERLDYAIVHAFYGLYGINRVPDTMLPMSIHWLGNSSVATIPTLYDLVVRKQFPSHTLQEGDAVLFAAAGGGMNINAVCYRY